MSNSEVTASHSLVYLSLSSLSNKLISILIVKSMDTAMSMLMFWLAPAS